MEAPEKRNNRCTPLREMASQDWRSKMSYPLSPLGATPRCHLPQQYGFVQGHPCAKAKSRKRRESEDDFKTLFERGDSLAKDVVDAKSLYTCIKERVKPPNVWTILFVGLFLLSLVCFVLLYYRLPKLQMNEARHVKFPRNRLEAKNLGKLLLRYKSRHFYAVFSGFFLTYIFLQSFAIPGTIFLSVLSGFLFPFGLALFLVCLCSSLGATCCYLLLSLTGHSLVYRLFHSHIAVWTDKVNQHQDNLTKYVIFLRLTPFLPNCFINILSPFIGLPLYAVFIGTFLGVALPSCLAIQCGVVLYQLTTPYGYPSWITVMQLIFFVVLSLISIIFKSKLDEKLE